MDGWKVDSATDSDGNCVRTEYFGGPEKMKEKLEQTYLGDVISADGSHTKNVLARKSKGQGVINQITQILDSVFFGKYHFEVALILRSSLLLSSLLLNSEAWVNFSDKDIRSLEQTDECLLAKILDCDSNTSNVFRYLELGIYPIRYEIMKRKILFLQYILQQEKNSMMFQVFQASKENPLKNDFIHTCNKYLNHLDIKLTFEEISKLSKYKFKQIVKQKVAEAGFKYLLEEKSRQTKIIDISYSKLEIQEYLVEGNKNTELSKVIFKARGMTLDFKTLKKWKYKDDICVGCGMKSETVEEFLSCSGLGDNCDGELSYNCVFGDKVQDMVVLASKIKRRMKIRQKIIDDNG